ncbi:MAG: alpha/beta fold hydrolase [Actinomycetota bacterium]|nr:alpha/beta fold hydrolase [Actinomycetota bacterium]
MPADGLAAEITGHGRRLVLVHGFTQTRRSWASLARVLAARYEVIGIDAPGHGDSGHADADLDTGAALLAATGGRATYVGYSMGGRLCLHVAVRRPDLVERLVLIAASPGLDDKTARRERRQADERLADHLERVGTEAFVDEWLSQPLFAGLTTATAGRRDRLRNDAASLAASLRRAGTGTQRPLWDDLGRITCPVLLLVGAVDDKFRRLADRMNACLPDATLATIPDAGHSVHLERPDATLDVLTSWLADHPPTARPTAAASP